MDAISLLKKDHATVKGLFKEVEDLGDRATTSRRKLFDRINQELTLHAQIEEHIFYPAFKERAEDTEERNTVLEAFEEHAIVKTLLHELEGLEPSDETYAPKLTVLMELVRQHVKEEEGTLFRMAREMFDRDELEQVGQELEAAKERGIAGAAPEPSAPKRFRRATRGEVREKARSR